MPAAMNCGALPSRNRPPLDRRPGLATTPPEQLTLAEAGGPKTDGGNQNLESAPG
jgi:hypothetical protein